MPLPRISSPELLAYGDAAHALAERYVLEREIGSGGMAYVYLARDLKHDRTVAVKVLRPELASSVNTGRFVREIEIAAGLTHPHILPVHDSGLVAGTLYYVMPYVKGENLATRMAREGAMPLADVMRITHEVASALQFAHEQGIVHRDIKPENVLLPGGVAVVSDFGLARALERDESSGASRLTEAGIGLGTPTYMSPEQGTGEEDVDARADQYSLACVVFEMLAGRPPFDGTSFKRLLTQHITEPAPRASSIRPDIPQNVDAALARAMAKTPADRFASIAKFVAALETGDAGALARHRDAQAWPISRRRRQIGTAVLAAVLVTAGGFAGYRTWNSRVDAVLDENLIAVAPFVAFEGPLVLWREGLVDILAHDLDAGPLRTVPPSTVVRSFKGPADQTTSIELARKTHAGLVVYGQVLQAGADSVRATVWLYDVARGAQISETEVRDLVTRMDRLADSIAIRLLRDLGNQRSIAAVPRAFFGAKSVPALKAFLLGEQFYRKNDFASAKVEYERAISLDSTFAPAYRRMRGVLRGLGSEFDSVSFSYAALAGAANHGTSLRDSLLILADSLAVAHRDFSAFVSPLWFASLRRRNAILERAAQEYPDDPEVWTELGELQTHYGSRLGIDQSRALRSFERALEADSVYGPAFFHAIELTILVHGVSAARPIVQRYLTVNPSDQRFVLVQHTLDSPSPDQIRRDVKRLSPEVRSAALTALRWDFVLPDPLLVTWEQSLEEATSLADSVRLRRNLFNRHLFRGHVQRAVAHFDTLQPPRSTAEVEAALMVAEAGGMHPTMASRVFDPLLHGEDSLIAIALPWWAHQRDTVSLRRAVARCERRRPRSGADDTAASHYCRQAGRALIALVDTDTATALRMLLALPDSTTSRTSAMRFDIARLLAARGQLEQAATYLDLRPTAASSMTIVVWNYERALLAERLGDVARAKVCYAFVAAAWVDGDPALQQFINRARFWERTPRPAER